MNAVSRQGFIGIAAVFKRLDRIGKLQMVMLGYVHNILHLFGILPLRALQHSDHRWKLIFNQNFTDQRLIIRCKPLWHIILPITNNDKIVGKTIIQKLFTDKPAIACITSERDIFDSATNLVVIFNPFCNVIRPRHGTNRVSYDKQPDIFSTGELLVCIQLSSRSNDPVKFLQQVFPKCRDFRLGGCFFCHPYPGEILQSLNIDVLAFLMVKPFVSYCRRTCNQGKHQQN